MKLHDLSPAPGSHRPRTRVGRGISGGKGKTAGRGTKGQKSRTGGTIQPWFEGGQTPIHVRLPKLRGFRNLLRVEYEVVNVGRISALAETGVLDVPALEGEATTAASRPAPVTITPDILAAAGLVRTLDRPLKILGQGDVSRPLFVIADAFSKSAEAKITAAGGTAKVVEMPDPARIGLDALFPAQGPSDETEPATETPEEAAPAAKAPVPKAAALKAEKPTGKAAAAEKSAGEAGKAAATRKSPAAKAAPNQ